MSLRFITQLEISFFPRCRSPGSNKLVDTCFFFFPSLRILGIFLNLSAPSPPPSHYPWFWGKHLYFNIQQLLVLFRAKKKKVPQFQQPLPILCTFPSSPAKETAGFSRKRQSGEGVIPCRWSSLLPVNSVSHRSAMLSISFA